MQDIFECPQYVFFSHCILSTAFISVKFCPINSFVLESNKAQGDSMSIPSEYKPSKCTSEREALHMENISVGMKLSSISA